MRTAPNENMNQIDRPISLWRRADALVPDTDNPGTFATVRLGDYDVALPVASCEGNPKLPLSQREKQVLLWSACGKTGPEISELLNVTLNTVSTYKSRILEKLGCRTIAEAVALATLYATGAKMQLGSTVGRG